MMSELSLFGHISDMLMCGSGVLLLFKCVYFIVALFLYVECAVIVFADELEKLIYA